MWLADFQGGKHVTRMAHTERDVNEKVEYYLMEIELKSNEVLKYRYDKSVYIAVIGTCGACYYCVNACPENAIKELKPPTIDHSKCTRCMKCVEACPRWVMQIVY